jgi:type IV pilus assembly protein PilE
MQGRGVAPARTAGFTLIELMVVVVIATLLLSIAIPSYMAQMRESRRTDARTALLDLAGREESYNSTMNAYTDVPSKLGYSGALFPVTIGSGYYQISACKADAGAIPACDPNANPPAGPSYYLTAAPVGAQANDTQCGTLAVDSLGNKFASGTASIQQCWVSQ